MIVALWSKTTNIPLLVDDVAHFEFESIAFFNAHADSPCVPFN